MAGFMTDLWESIFTPGPTPTLLIAANASFGALQIVLFFLFVATYSAHFIALSVICAGVWWGINWFAVELRKAQAAEEEAARIRKARLEKSGATGPETSGGEAGSEGEETEVEEPFEGKKAPPPMNKLNIRGGPQKALAVMESARLAREKSGDAAQGTALESPAAQSGLLNRKSPGESSSADLSSVGTDSEWEKVSEGGT
jgi:hypothetical protein